MKETEFFAKLQPHLAAWGEYDRVENLLSSGMSDVYYNIAGRTGWIETKVAKGDFIYFEKFQPNWIAKHHRQGARMYVMVLDKNETIHLYPAGVILQAPRYPRDKFTVINMNDLPRVFNMERPWKSWKSIREILIS